MDGSSDPVYGHIMCNEMKLWSDSYWNPKNRKCVGIIVEGDKDRITSLASKLAKLYKGGSKKEAKDAKDSTYSISLSVKNQFRFRSSIDNRTHTHDSFSSITVFPEEMSC